MCAVCFSSLVGSGIYLYMNRWWSGSRGVGLCNEAARLSRLLVMSSCLNEGKRCSGVGPGGRFMSDDASIVCHLMAMGVVRGSWVEEVCVRIFRYSGDSVCRSLRQ